MKLNLVPSSVTKASRSRTAIILSVLIALLGIAGGIGAAIYSSGLKAAAIERHGEWQTAANSVQALSEQADTTIAGAAGIIRNAKLAEAMIASNAKYPDFYERLKRDIPPFFRLTYLNATPVSDTQASVTMQGTVGSLQEYADLMLALLRYENVLTVSRQGYIDRGAQVPALTETDQVGAARRAGEQPIPTDPLERLEYLVARAQDTGFDNVGNFGTEADTRGAMPGDQIVTVTMLVNENLQAPDINATLASGGAPATPGGPGAPAGFPPPGPGNIPTGPPPGQPGGQPGPPGGFPGGR